jgi:hypothetical protein
VPAKKAAFQFARFSDTSYFFSPAYVDSGAAVSSAPFLRGLDRELRPLVATHVVALSARRLAATGELFLEGGEDRPVIVFDTVAEDTATVFAPDTTPSAVVQAARDAIAAQITALRRAVGANGVLLILGGPPTTRQAGVPAWFRVVSGGADLRSAGAEVPSGLTFEAVRATIRYLVGLQIEPAEKALVPAAIATRFPVRPSVRVAAAPQDHDPPGQEWSAGTLESIPGALGSGR